MVLSKQYEFLRQIRPKKTASTQTTFAAAALPKAVWTYKIENNEKILTTLSSVNYATFGRQRVDIYARSEIFSRFALIHISSVSKNDISNVVLALVREHSLIKMTVKINEGTRVVQRRLFSPVTFRVRGLYGPTRLTMPIIISADTLNFKIEKKQLFALQENYEASLQKLIEPITSFFGLQNFILYNQGDTPKS